MCTFFRNLLMIFIIIICPLQIGCRKPGHPPVFSLHQPPSWITRNMHFTAHIELSVLTESCRLTSFVFDDHIEFVTLGYFQRFVLGVFGVIRGDTRVCFCDKRLGHFTGVCVKSFASEFILRGHDDDAEEEEQHRRAQCQSHAFILHYTYLFMYSCTQKIEPADTRFCKCYSP